MVTMTLYTRPQRRLVVYSPWVHKESDTTEQLTHTHIQSEVSQKEKHQYSILTNIYGIYKDGNNEPICKTARDTM